MKNNDPRVKINEKYDSDISKACFYSVSFYLIYIYYNVIKRNF